MELRPYQSAAVVAVYDYLRNNPGRNPCVVIPTGGGKTPVIASIARDVVRRWAGRILVLAHVKELLEQAEEKLLAVDSNLPVGVYSAGLGRRNASAPVVVAGIQSIYKKACDVGPFNLVVVDEAHLIPPNGEGMYRTFLQDALVVNPTLRLIGLTATPYRMSTGEICGPENLLHDVCFDVGVRQLVIDGYLSPLISKRGLGLDTSGLSVSKGEFASDETEALMMGNIGPAVSELLVYTAKRHSVLVFASGIAHAVEVCNRIGQAGFDVALVTGDTEAPERSEYIEQFKRGDLRYLVNVNVLTTGFDAPNVDCVALLRPTLSPGLYYQMVGRGFRKAPGKSDCLVLDFGGNVERHGPVDALQVRNCKPREGESGEAPAKTCPNCQAIIAAGYATCPDCAYVFPCNGKEHDATASEAAPMSGGDPVITSYDVYGTCYSVHQKRNAPADHPCTMRVEYEIGPGHYVSEWVCIEHAGFAKGKARQWWDKMSDEPFPETAGQAVSIAESGLVKQVLSIRVREMPGSKWPEVVHREIGDYPAPEETTPVAAVPAERTLF